MLDTLRRASTSWFFKLFFLLLVASFALWGIGDMVRSLVPRSPAMTIGKVEITVEDVGQEYKRELDRLQTMFGGKLTDEQARQFGLLDRTVQQMTVRALLDLAGNDLGLSADDETLRRQIAANPAFHNQFGRFDSQVFRSQLSRMGYSEDMFTSLARRDMVRSQLAGVATGGVKAPTVLADPLYRHRMERRVAELASFATDRMPIPPAPGEDLLQAWYKEHSQRFMAPEYRGLTFLLLRPVDVAGDIQVSDEQVKEAYEAHQSEYGEPERRVVEQILLDSEAEAQKAREMVRDGKKIQDIAAIGDKPREVQPLGWVTKGDLPEDLAEAVFALPEKAISEPVKSGLGWHVFHVPAISPAKVKPL
ncbi:MAG: SurA N-terminal domain-containing protein, partial [Rhodospirillales bacterium]|nr:SurA N-terminal domain-containing protein [Rhodospirillales bacterium]